MISREFLRLSLKCKDKTGFRRRVLRDSTGGPYYTTLTPSTLFLFNWTLQELKDSSWDLSFTTSLVKSLTVTIHKNFRIKKINTVKFSTLTLYSVYEITSDHLLNHTLYKNIFIFFYHPYQHKFSEIKMTEPLNKRDYMWRKLFLRTKSSFSF